MAGETARSRLWALMVSASFYRPSSCILLVCRSIVASFTQTEKCCSLLLMFLCYHFPFMENRIYSLEGCCFYTLYFLKLRFLCATVHHLVSKWCFCVYGGEQIRAGRLQSVSMQWINKAFLKPYIITVLNISFLSSHCYEIRSRTTCALTVPKYCRAARVCAVQDSFHKPGCWHRCTEEHHLSMCRVLTSHKHSEWINGIISSEPSDTDSMAVSGDGSSGSCII